MLSTKLSRLLGATLCFLLFAAFASADVVITPKGKTYESVWIAAINTGATPDIQGYRVKQGRLLGRPQILTLALVQTVEFREPGDVATRPAGRLAHLRAADGRYLYNAVIETATRTPKGFVITMRSPGVPPGGATKTLSLAALGEIRLAPAPISMTGLPPVASTPGKPATAPSSTSGGTYLDDDKDEAFPGFPSDDVLQMETFMASQRGLVGPEEILNELYNTPTGQPKSPFLINPMPVENPYSLSGSGSLVIIGMAVGLMVITFVFGTFVLLFSARNEGIKDLTVPRAIAASALLAFIPPSILIGAFLIPTFTLIKITVGVFGFYYSARTIVMGILEVMESKATDVLISFYALLIFLVMVYWIYRTWA
ncbi:hypothetical protein BH09SUM1_BH09SUM1_30650 [soil metagenome]